MKIIKVGAICAEVEKKSIKNMYIRVLPPDGRVKVTAPRRMSDAQITDALKARTDWISRQCERISRISPATEHKCESGDTVYLWGQSYTLVLKEAAGRGGVEVRGDEVVLTVKPGSTQQDREAALDKWLRDSLTYAIPELAEKNEHLMGVHAEEWHVRKMKTRWGSCNTTDRRIWINLRLAAKMPECLEYVIVHELCHLLERGHNKRFYAYMDSFFPDWKSVKKLLNEDP